jgi:hypothetical protein
MLISLVRFSIGHRQLSPVGRPALEQAASTRHLKGRVAITCVLTPARAQEDSTPHPSIQFVDDVA